MAEQEENPAVNAGEVNQNPPDAIEDIDEDEIEVQDITMKGIRRVLHTRTRFILMALLLLCLASVWSNILCFNFALICFIQDDNGTIPSKQPFATQFTIQQRSFLTAWVAIGALVAYGFVVTAVSKLGIRSVFTVLGICSAIATCCLPMAIKYGFWYTAGARFVQGIAFAANFPAIGAFTFKWTYYKQNGLFVSVLVAYIQLSPTLTMTSSGAMCESPVGWPLVFYVHAGVSALVFVLFACFFRNSPAKHPCVNEIELRKIASNKIIDKKQDIPICAILGTGSVWAVWLAAFGNFTCVNMMFLYAPIYMKHVLHYEVHSSGLSSALGPCAQFAIKLVAGWTSDKVRCLNETNKLRAYNSIAFVGSAVFLLGLAFVPADKDIFCLFMFGVAAGALGFTTGGFFKAAPLVSKQYSHFVTGNISLAITATLLAVPFVVDGLTPNNTAEEWRWVFIITAGVLFVTNLAFIILCSAQPAPWTIANPNAVQQSQEPVVEPIVQPTVPVQSPGDPESPASPAGDLASPGYPASPASPANVT